MSLNLRNWSSTVCCTVRFPARSCRTCFDKKCSTVEKELHAVGKILHHNKTRDVRGTKRERFQLKFEFAFRSEGQGVPVHVRVRVQVRGPGSSSPRSSSRSSSGPTPFCGGGGRTRGRAVVRTRWRVNWKLSQRLLRSVSSCQTCVNTKCTFVVLGHA